MKNQSLNGRYGFTFCLLLASIVGVQSKAIGQTVPISGLENNGTLIWEDDQLGYLIINGPFTGASTGVIENLGAFDLTITANQNVDTEYAGILVDSAPLTGAIYLIKAGSGTLTFSGSNGYSGSTTITGGALQAVDGVGLPSNSNLVFGGSLTQNGYGAVLQSSGTFIRPLGAGPGQVQWTGDGGFAANGGPLAVSMSPGTPLVWNNNALRTGTPGFVPDGSVLTFGSPTANNQVNFTDSIDLNGEIRQIDVAAGAGGDSALISGNIIDSVGGGGLTKTGAGTLILASSSTYTGSTTISGGALQAVDGVGLPSKSNLVLSGNLAQNGYGAVFQSSGSFSRSIGTGPGQVQWTGDGGFAANGGPLTVSMSPGAPLVWNNNALGTGTQGFVPDGSALTFGSHTANNQVNFTDGIDLNGEARQIDVTAGAGGDSALISGNIIDSAGGGGLIKTGNGTLLLGGSNSYAGGTAIDGGVLSLANSAALPVGGKITFGGGTLQYTTSNTQDYSSAIVGSTGPISIDSNGLNITFGSNLSASNGGGLTKIGNGTLTLGVSNSYSGNTLISNGTLALGDPGALQQSTFDTSGSGVLSFGTLTSATFGGLTGTGAMVLNNASSSAVTLRVGNDSASTTFSGDLGGTGSLIKIGNGALTLAAVNSYAGPTAINGGVLSLANSAALPVGGNITFGGGTLQYTASNTQDYSSEIVDSTEPISIDTNGVSVTFASSLTSSNSGGLTKIGNGTLTLAAINSYAGSTAINGGVLSLANSAALPAGGNITFGGGTLQYTASNAQDYSSAIVDSTGPISIDTNGVSVTFASSLASSNCGGLTKIGNGTLTLAAINSYVGPTAINGGVLSLANSAALPVGGNITFGGGTLQYTASNAQDYSSEIVSSTGPISIDTNGVSVTFASSLASSNSGGLTKIGAGALTLVASNSNTGGTTISGGTLEIGNGGVSGSIANTSTVLNNAALVFDRGDSVTFSPSIRGSGTVTQAGTGSLTLLGSNTYTGATMISAGTLCIGNGGSGASIGATSGVLDASSLVFNHGGAVTFAPPISGGGNVTQTGTGTLTLLGSNSYAGGTFVDAGTLVFASSGSIGGSGANVTVDYGSAAAAGYPMNQSFLGRLAPSSSGVAALTASDSNALSFASLPNVRLGALGTVNYSGTLTPGGSNYRLGGGGGTLTVSGPLTGANNLDVGAGGTPAGTVILSRSTSFTGSTTVSGGTLVLGSPFSLQDSTLDTSGSGLLSFGTLSTATLGGLSGPGTLPLRNTALGPVALSVGNNDADTTFSGALSGRGSLTKIGDGTLLLSGTDTYAGGTIVEEGTLEINTPSALPIDGSLAIGAGGTFIFDPTLTGAPLGASPSSAVSAVPEPSAVWLLAVSAFGMLAHAWRRGKRPT